jgi:hypothetical protein
LATPSHDRSGIDISLHPHSDVREERERCDKICPPIFREAIQVRFEQCGAEFFPCAMSLVIIPGGESELDFAI